MPTIQPYTARNLPSPAVGTPGFTSPVGAAFRQNAGLLNNVAGNAQGLADRLGQAGASLENTMLQAQSQNMQGWMNLGHQVVGIIGQAIQKHQANVAAQKKMLQQGQAAQANYAFQESADQDFSSFTQQFQNTPWQAPEAWKDYLHNQKQSVLDDPQYENTSPEFKQLLSDQLESSIVPRMERMNTWSASAQSNQIHQAVPKTISHVENAVSNLQGDLPSKVAATVSATSNALQQFSGLHDPLGKENMDRASDAVMSTAGESLVKNALLPTEIPSEPAPRFGYFQMLRNLVDTGSVGPGQPRVDWKFDTKTKTALHKQINASESQAENDLVTSYQVKEAQLAGSVTAQIDDANKQRWSPVAQQAALTSADRMEKQLNDEQKLALQNPWLNDKRKATIINSINARRSQVSHMRSVAQSNLDRQSSEQAAEQRFNVQEANSDARFEAQQQHDSLMAQQREQSESFRQAKGQTAQELAMLQSKLRNTADINEGANQPETFQAAISLAKRANQALLDGHISRAQYDSLRNSAENIYIGTAKLMQVQPNQFMALFGAQPELASVPKNQLAKVVSDARSQIGAGWRGIESHVMMQQASKSNLNTPEQDHYINTQMAAWEKAYPGATSQARDHAHTLATTLAKQKFPGSSQAPSTIAHPKTQHAPSAIMIQKQNDMKRSKDGLVPPPPPTVPSAKMWSNDQIMQAVEEARSRGLIQ
ncbi:MAG: hypothetical protein KGL39_31535 [Patescibacteria group bacterium]|nr:hypothetical protein [Patescibacteria group bacterium]